MELAASCDLRIAAEDTRFGMPEIRVGMPSVIEAALLVPLIGLAVRPTCADRRRNRRARGRTDRLPDACRARNRAGERDPGAGEPVGRLQRTGAAAAERAGAFLVR